MYRFTLNLEYRGSLHCPVLAAGLIVISYDTAKAS